MEKILVRKKNEVYMEVFCNRGVEYELRDYFSFFVPNYQYMSKYKMKVWDGKIKLYNTQSKLLYVGLLKKLRQFCSERDYDLEIDDRLEKSDILAENIIGADITKLNLPFELRDYQYHGIKTALQQKRGLIISPTGCHTKDTKILMYDGTTKNVQDIKIGDQLIGPDGKSRKVLKLHRGKGKIYKISSNSKKTKQFKDFYINDEHILSLKNTSTGKIINISVSEYIEKNKNFKHLHKLYFSNIEIEFEVGKELKIDPYFFGAYLGDGHSGKLAITTLDKEMQKYCTDYIKETFNINTRIANKKGTDAITLRFSGENRIYNKRNKHPLRELFREYGINIGGKNKITCGTKFIPNDYKYSSIKDRFELLAGLLDTDGHLSSNGTYFTYSSKSEGLVDDVIFVARSLGFFVRKKYKYNKKYNKTYYGCSIMGETYKIPTKIPRKMARHANRNKDVHHHGFNVEYCRTDDFYGFSLDKDRLYLMDNFLVTHNSGKSAIIYGITRLLRKRTLIIVPTVDLVLQMYQDFQNYSQHDRTFDPKKEIHTISAGARKYTDKNIVISTWQSIYKLPKTYFEQFEAVIGDEVHLFQAKSLVGIMEKCHNADVRIGTTGTLQDSQTHQLVLEGLFGKAEKLVSTKELMDSKTLAKLSINCIILKYPEEVCKEITNLKYHEEIDFILHNKTRNRFIRNLAISRKGNTLVLFQYVKKHGKPLFEYIESKVKELDPSRKVFYVAGSTDKEDRLNIRKITEKETNAIIVASAGVFSTGVNIKNLENVIFAAPSKAKIKILQSIGRALRYGRTGKAYLYDIADDLSYKSKRNTTLKHFLERMKIYINEKFEYKVQKIDIKE